MTDLIVVPQTNQWHKLKALVLDSVPIEKAQWDYPGRAEPRLTLIPHQPVSAVRVRRIAACRKVMVRVVP